MGKFLRVKIDETTITLYGGKIAGNMATYPPMPQSGQMGHRDQGQTPFDVSNIFDI